MSDFLARLAARALGTEAVLVPRLPSLFEPAGGASALSAAPLESAVEREAPAPAAAHARQVAAVDIPPAPHAASTMLAPAPLCLPVTERESFVPARTPHDVERRASVPGDTVRSRGHEAPPVPPVATAPHAPPLSPPSPPVAPRSARIAPQRAMSVPTPAAPARASVQAAPAAAVASRASQPRSAASPAPPRPRAQVPAMPAAPATETVVQVSIGRIEVRAAPATSAPSRRRDEPRPTRLDDYLRQRSGKGAP